MINLRVQNYRYIRLIRIAMNFYISKKYFYLHLSNGKYIKNALNKT